MEQQAEKAGNPSTASNLPVGRQRAITFRSFVLGTLASAAVCVVTPYNDYVVNNTVLVGSYFPIALTILLFVLIVLVNGPLHRFRPRSALSTSELAVIIAMLLAGCSVASQGLMRGWLPNLVSPFHIGELNREFWLAFTRLGLPQWLFPVDMETGARSSIVEGFYNRLPPDQPVPYGAWVIPLLGWGIFFGSMFATLLALAAILGPQWSANERLSFPLVQVQLALIEPPQPGKALNRLFRSKGFWVAAGAVFVLQSMVALNQYLPEYVPAPPLRYDLSSVFANEPLVYFNWSVKVASIYFTLIGFSYFIPSRVSFSLWALYLLKELLNVQQRSMQSEIPYSAWQDQHLGATVAFVCGILFIGRHRLMETVRCLLPMRSAKPAAATAADMTPVPRWAALLSIIGPAVMFVWLVALGVQTWVALLFIGIIFAAHLVVARIVAETGLPFIRSYASPLHVITGLSPRVLTGADVYFAGICTINATMTTRETLLTYAMHGKYLTDTASGRPGRPAAFFGLIAWAVLVGIVAGAVASLYCYYRYAMPLAVDGQPPLNPMATATWPQDLIASPLQQFAAGRFSPRTHSSPLHMSIGFVITAALQFASLRWVAWPLLPVGYLASTTWYMDVGWFSLLLGWAAKILIGRFGGATLYRQARPLFIGLVFGEALAVAAWMLISLFLALSGETYHVVNLMPT